VGGTLKGGGGNWPGEEVKGGLKEGLCSVWRKHVNQREKGEGNGGVTWEAGGEESAGGRKVPGRRKSGTEKKRGVKSLVLADTDMNAGGKGSESCALGG